LVKLVAGALEEEKTMTELLELPREFFIHGKRIGRKKEILFGKETLRGKRTSNGGELEHFQQGKTSNAQRRTPNLESKIFCAALICTPRSAQWRRL
jgi:hypothetical protein